MITKKIKYLALRTLIISLLAIGILACETENNQSPSTKKTNAKTVNASVVEDEEGNISAIDQNGADSKAQPVNREFSGEVVGVTDGDTIKVLEHNREIRIRLAEIDCPESSQDFGQKAKQFTSELAFGKDVKLLVKDMDRYGRTVAEVILPDGRSLNRELIKAGLAWWYQHYSSDETLGQLQEEAKAAKRGLWSMDNPTPPWDFRHRR